MDRNPDILVTAATGKTGQALSALLHEAGAAAVGMTSRSPSDVHTCPLPLRYGDLRKPESLKAAFEGIKVLYLITPLGPDETEIGLEAIASAEAAGIEKIVYIAVHNLEAMRDIPHFETKIPIKVKLLASERHVVLAPNFFMQNDLMMLPAITQGGIYPMPVGVAGVWSIDARDIGLAAFRALTKPDWDGQTVPLCGPEKMTGPEIAGAWARGLGRSVVYGGDNIQPWLEQVKQGLPPDPWFENDFRRMMEVTQAKGCEAGPEAQAATRAILGRAPRDYTAFIADTLSTIQ